MDMKKDHVYIAKNALAAARHDIESRTPHPGIIYDEVSPFKKMKSIQVEENQAPKGANGIRFRVKHITKPNTAAFQDIFIPTVLAKATPGIMVPRKCRHFTTLRNNILGENEEEMRYLPYFGEGAEDDVLDALELSDLFIDKTKSSIEDGRIMECASFYNSFMLDFLMEVDVSLDAIIQYLIGDISQKDADLAGRKALLPNDFNGNDPKLESAKARANSVAPTELKDAERIVWHLSSRRLLQQMRHPLRLATKKSLSSLEAILGRTAWTVMRL
ncbi:hypothetical protein FN846DRAFT_47049 [Sphaerosporella brunnea]|uniref:Uncharacterized protein n=1 Tax=Sphaerosporella brunnea TaxID=1250544 RepID=A0A5J5EUK2_9PEZI|nr:hypothetical protein FN846DRAFT_47049 [Sphaerosporella brunnea]